MNWNVDPEIFRIGPLALRYYSLLIVLGFILMGRYMGNIFLNKDGKHPEAVSSLTTYIIVGMIVGARLGHCFFYDPAYYLARPLEILFVWEGGLASHGGYAGVITAVYFYLKKNPRFTFFQLMDALAAPCLVMGGLIRIGNLMNSEIYGTPTDLPWAVVFQRVDMIPRHPSQVYESIGYFSISLLLFALYKFKAQVWKSGSIFAVGITVSFIFRFFIEFTKDEQSSLTTQSAINMGQWLSLAFVAFGIALFVVIQKNSKTVKQL